MVDLLDLLKLAEEGSRELDAKIIAQVIGGEAAPSEINGVWCVYRGTDRHAKPKLWQPLGQRERSIWHALTGTLGPTRALDAALTLRPEGANSHGYDLTPNEVTAYWSRNSVGEGHWLSEGRHKTSVPIAFCIAYLKRQKTLANQT